MTSLKISRIWFATPLSVNLDNVGLLSLWNFQNLFTGIVAAHLRRHPRFKLSDRFTLCRKLDVRVDGVDVFSARMPHQCFANFLHDACFHEPCVKRVAEVMEPAIADARTTDSSLPSGLDDADRFTLKRKEQTLLLAFGKKKIVNAGGEGNFPSFTSSGFGTCDKEQIAV